MSNAVAESGALVRFKSGSNRTPEQRKSHGRSRVSNGADILPNVDGRSLIARRFRDIASAILIDQGGDAQCSESRKQLVRRFAAAAVLAEQMEAQLAKGEQINIAEHALLVSSLVRIVNKIGLNRIPRDVTPTLGSILRQGTERERDHAD